MDKERLKEVWVYTCGSEHTGKSEWPFPIAFQTINGMVCPCDKPMRCEDWSEKPGVTTVQGGKE